MAKSENWISISESNFAWEREALEFIRSQFPPYEPYRAWSSFEFIAEDAKYREIVGRRIQVIETSPEIALIEQPEYKRRWNWEPWDSQKERALRECLLDRLESYFDFDGRMNDKHEPTAEVDVSLISVAKLADIADIDQEFHQVGAALQGDLAFDINRLVTELVAAESVPLLPILRYKPTGLRKRAEWEQTWELQRREDAGEKEK